MKTLECDSEDYDVITRAIRAIPGSKEGMTCEVGLRRGGGTKYIMDALAHHSLPCKVHVAIDPYGNIDYQGKEGIAKKADYTNEMRDESIGSIYSYAMSLGVNFVFINLDDAEFFKRYANGVPVYNEHKRILSEYVFVHFDGPHWLESLKTEFLWFDERMTSGATIVFDDVCRYDHNKLQNLVFSHGWRLLEATTRKASYQK